MTVVAPPRVRDGVVPRRALANRVRNAPIVELVAPAGYGKTTLLAEVAAADGAAVLVDDAHRVGRDAVLELAAGLPDGSRLLVASRVRLDLGGVELGPGDLRLTDPEAAAVLGVDEDVAARLNERLDGWPAAVYLASLARESGRSLDDFDGADRWVAEYVRDELLDGLAAADVRFLTGCAALDLLSAPLCNAALATRRSAERLEQLESDTLLLPSEPGGYRLQRAVRAALLADLRRREPGAAEAISARAADWHERHGRIEDAVPYAWAAGQPDRFAALVGRCAAELWHSGRADELEAWLTPVDEERLARYPDLAVWSAVLAAVQGRGEDARRLADIAGQAPRGGHSPRLARLRAAIFPGIPPDLPAKDNTALLMLGVAHLLAGDLDAAQESLCEVAVDVEAVTASLALAELAVIAAGELDWETSERAALQARAVVHEHGLGNYATSALALAASARSAVAHSDWVRARSDAAGAAALLPSLTGALPWLAVQTRLELAAAYVQLSEHDTAAGLLDEADALLASAEGLGALAHRAAELRGELGGPASTQPGKLTPAESRLLPLLTTHMSFREIAEVLGVSRNTVKTQAICVYRKLGVSSRSAAIERASELGLVARPNALDRT